LKFLRFFSILPVAISVISSAQTSPSLNISANGISNLQRKIGPHELTVTFTTHETKTPDRTSQFPFDWASVCTGSRNPCVLLDNLRIQIDHRDLFVARSSYADCSDLNTAAATSKDGIYSLVLSGGDASESYMVILRFSNDHLIDRVLIAGEDTSHIVEKTTYNLMH